MTREELVREALVLTCFLENINTNETGRIAYLLQWLENCSEEELAHYYEVNNEIKNIRFERLVIHVKTNNPELK